MALAKAYYCLMCQKPLSVRVLLDGAPGHHGHLLTEFQCETEYAPSDNELLRKFREKWRGFKNDTIRYLRRSAGVDS